MLRHIGSTRVVTLNRLRYVLHNTRGRLQSLHRSHGPSRRRHPQPRSSAVRALYQHHLHLYQHHHPPYTLRYSWTTLDWDIRQRQRGVPDLNFSMLCCQGVSPLARLLDAALPAVHATPNCTQGRRFTHAAELVTRNWAFAPPTRTCGFLAGAQPPWAFACAGLLCGPSLSCTVQPPAPAPPPGPAFFCSDFAGAISLSTLKNKAVPPAPAAGARAVIRSARLWPQRRHPTAHDSHKCWN